LFYYYFSFGLHQLAGVIYTINSIPDLKKQKNLFLIEHSINIISKIVLSIFL